MAAVPAYAYALPYLPLGITGTYCVDLADDFVSWNAWILNAGPLAFLCERVTMAHPACLDLDAHFPHTWYGYISFHNLKFCSRLGNLHRFH
jgi:hypothetical protein